MGKSSRGRRQAWPHTAPISYQGDERIARVLDDRRRLPKILQPLQGLLTAVPDVDCAIPERSPVQVLLRDVGLLSGFATLAGYGSTLLASGSLAASVIGGPMALFGVLGAVGRLRRLVVGHNHEAGHGSVKRWYMAKRGWSKPAARRVNEAIIDLATALTFTMNGQDYRREHNRHHAISRLGTLRDPDGAQLRAWKFWGNMKPGEFRARLLLTILSPAWHGRFLWARVRSNLLKGRPYRRVLGLASLAALGGLAAVLPTSAWVAAILVPWTWGYQTASLLQVLTRHNYPHARGARTLGEYVARTWERIPWSPMPFASGLSWEGIKTWSVWAAKIALVHIPSRLTVLDTSMIWHGWHHAAWPAGQPFDDWWNVAYRAIAARRDGKVPPEAASRVLWGLLEALPLQAKRMEGPRD